MRVVADRVERGSSEITRRVALAVDQTIVLATPVDTGRARSNWVVSVGGSASGTIEPYSAGEGGSTGAANAQAAIEQGRAAIQERQPGQDIHITNNLPYIGRLNEGHSAQAPSGFVERAIQAGVQAVRGARILE